MSAPFSNFKHLEHSLQVHVGSIDFNFSSSGIFVILTAMISLQTQCGIDLTHNSINRAK